MLVLLLLLAACGSQEDASLATSATAEPVETSLPFMATVAPTPSPTRSPHQAAVAVIEVIEVRAGDADARVVAMRLRGDVGTSAIFRSLEIRAALTPIEGSRCDVPPEPMLLRPAHPDAVAPALADQTRDVIIRPGSMVGTFQAGPIPSLNGAFEGWVSFQVPVASADGFCAFDLSGVVVVVAGETIRTELPGLRVDTRERLDDR